jgi:uncharacterized protein
MLTIDEIKKIITPICIKYGVKKMYLFGSYARKEATILSDIDVRIDAGNIKDLFTLSAFRIDLVAALGIEVDIISTAPVSLEFRKSLSSDEVLLYAA